MKSLAYTLLVLFGALTVAQAAAEKKQEEAAAAPAAYEEVVVEGEVAPDAAKEPKPN